MGIRARGTVDNDVNLVEVVRQRQEEYERFPTARNKRRLEVAVAQLRGGDA